jgi:hypothetical protein
MNLANNAIFSKVFGDGLSAGLDVPADTFAPIMILYGSRFVIVVCLLGSQEVIVHGANRYVR